MKKKAVERYRPISLDVALWWAVILTRWLYFFPERDPRIAQYGGTNSSCYPPPPCWSSQCEGQPTGRRTVGVPCWQEHGVMPQVLTFKEVSPLKLTSRLAALRYLGRWPPILLYSKTWRHKVWYKITDVSEVSAGSRRNIPYISPELHGVTYLNTASIVYSRI